MDWWRRAWSWLADPGDLLARRVAHGGVWVFLINGVDRTLQLVRTVVLARLLAPEDFGLFGITLVALSALERFTKTGFETALIQKRDLDRDILDTAWIVRIGRGIALGAVLLLAAPLVASFFEEPGAASLMRALAAVAVLSGLENIGVVYFRKDIEFHKEFLLKLASTLPDLVASIAAALVLRNAWALVVGLLVGQLARTVTSYLVHTYRPRPRFELDQARELFDFGKHITAQSILLFLLTEGDDILVGKVLGAASLGLYQVAYRIANAAAKVTHGISKVAFPAYAQLQAEPERMNRGFLRTLGLTAFLSLPIAAALGTLAPEIVRFFLGDSWTPMVPALQIICVFGAMRAIGASFGPVYRAVARVEAETKAAALQLGVLVAIVYPTTVRWEITGTAGAITVAMLGSLIYSSLQISRITGLSLTRLYAPVAAPAAGVVAAVLLTLGLEAATPFPGPLAVELALLLLSGAVTYLVVVGLLYRAVGYGFKDLRALVEAMLG